MKKLVPAVAAIATAAALAGCGSRGADVVSACKTHGGVVALDDDVVVCQDQTVRNVDED